VGGKKKNSTKNTLSWSHLQFSNSHGNKVMTWVMLLLTFCSEPWEQHASQWHEKHWKHQLMWEVGLVTHSTKSLNNNKRYVTLWPCQFTFQSILRQKKNDRNSNISPCKNIICKKSSKRNQKPSRYYNCIITNLGFQHKPKYHVSKILI